MGSVITLIATVSGSGAWAVQDQMDVPQNGTLEGVCISASGDFDTDGDSLEYNLTFSSTAGTPGSESRSSIISGGMQFQVVTSGAILGPGVYYCKLPEIPVSVGERIFMHATATSGVTARLIMGLHFSFNQAVPSSRR